jgi:predicted nucleotidyltransferase
MIDTLISSKTRIKLLLKFFLNSKNRAYLRNLEEEFGESTNAIRLELNRFEEAGMLLSKTEGNKKIFKANILHPLFGDIRNIVMKYVGIDQILEYVIKRLGQLEEVYLVGDFARGLNGDIIDLVFVGKIDQQFLTELVEKTEKRINRRIRYIVFEPNEFALDRIGDKRTEPLLLWSR